MCTSYAGVACRGDLGGETWNRNLADRQFWGDRVMDQTMVVHKVRESCKRQQFLPTKTCQQCRRGFGQPRNVKMHGARPALEHGPLVNFMQPCR